jgi:hypothetical protein
LPPRSAFAFEQPLVTDRTVFGSVSVDFGPIQTHVASCQHANFLGVQEDVHKQMLQFPQKGFANMGKGVMSGMATARHAAEGDGLVGGLFSLAGTEGARSIARKSQA